MKSTTLALTPACAYAVRSASIFFLPDWWVSAKQLTLDNADGVLRRVLQRARLNTRVDLLAARHEAGDEVGLQHGHDVAIDVRAALLLDELLEFLAPLLVDPEGAHLHLDRRARPRLVAPLVWTTLALELRADGTSSASVAEPCTLTTLPIGIRALSSGAAVQISLTPLSPSSKKRDGCQCGNCGATKPIV
mgnify:CR=1 FL=1